MEMGCRLVNSPSYLWKDYESALRDQRVDLQEGQRLPATESASWEGTRGVPSSVSSWMYLSDPGTRSKSYRRMQVHRTDYPAGWANRQVVR
jgi:hypothetical protein